jgi:hypothetical protein
MLREASCPSELLLSSQYAPGLMDRSSAAWGTPATLLLRGSLADDPGLLHLIFA